VLGKISDCVNSLIGAEEGSQARKDLLAKPLPYMQLAERTTGYDGKNLNPAFNKVFVNKFF